MKAEAVNDPVMIDNSPQQTFTYREGDSQIFRPQQHRGIGCERDGIARRLAIQQAAGIRVFGGGKQRPAAVLFHAADRGFQRFFKAVEPKWDLKTDWQIICEIATRMGYPMKYDNTQQIWDELRHLCPNFFGATYEKMGELGYVQWPCRDESEADQGTSYLFAERFSTPNGLAQFFTCEWQAPIDKLSDAYPLVLSTVREVGHYSCRSMTGNCAALAKLADEPGYIQINTADAKRLGIEDEELVWVNSRKGKVISRAKISDRPNKGAVYMTYQWWIGACNELVTENLSPITKTPEYKYCAVNVERIADRQAAERYVIEEYSKLKARLRESAAG